MSLLHFVWQSNDLSGTKFVYLLFYQLSGTIYCLLYSHE